MSEGEEWGPWIDHDGKGCPCVGMTVRIYCEDGVDMIGVPDRYADQPRPGRHSVWIWCPRTAARKTRVLRYRIRKPRALIQLREMIETLPAPSRKEDA